jgi:hypothetical protein
MKFIIIYITCLGWLLLSFQVVSAQSLAIGLTAAPNVYLNQNRPQKSSNLSLPFNHGLGMGLFWHHKGNTPFLKTIYGRRLFYDTLSNFSSALGDDLYAKITTHFLDIQLGDRLTIMNGDKMAWFIGVSAGYRLSLASKFYTTVRQRDGSRTQILFEAFNDNDPLNLASNVQGWLGEAELGFQRKTNVEKRYYTFSIIYNHYLSRKTDEVKNSFWYSPASNLTSRNFLGFEISFYFSKGKI